MCVAWLMVPLRSLTSPASCPPWPPWFSFPSPTPISLKSRVTRGREKLPCAASLPTRLPWLGLVQARARSSVAVSPVDGKDPGTQAVCPGASAGSWFRSITSGTPCSSDLGHPCCRLQRHHLLCHTASPTPSVPRNSWVLGKAGARSLELPAGLLHGGQGFSSLGHYLQLSQAQGAVLAVGQQDSSQ